jgi:hypothetical protein
VGNLAPAAGPSATFTVDNTAPSLVISPPSVTVANSAMSVTYTVTYTGADVITLATGSVSLNRTSTANTSSVTISGTDNLTRTVTISGLSGDGTIGISIAAGTASDLAGNLVPAAGPSATFTVNNAAPSLVISAPTVTYNANALVTVTVSSAATPTGNVALSVDSGPTTTLPLDGSGSATFTITSPNVGNHTLSATYPPTGIFLGNSGLGNLTVNPAVTTAVISTPSVTYHADGIVTVTISSLVGTPTGTVSLSVDSGAAMTQSLNGSGIATFTVSGPNAGNRNLIASYAAQGNYGASTGSGTLTVNPAATTTAIISAPSVTYNANGLVTVLVSSGTGTPTGTVSLSVDGGTAMTQPLNGSGIATFTVSGPNAGNRNLIASYAAQGNYGASTGSGTLTVNPAATTMGINAPSVTYGTNGSVAVTVSSSTGTPSGIVTLSVDGGSLLTQSLNGSGIATFTVATPNAGSRSLSASYAAQGNFLASAITGTLTVSKAVPTATLSTNAANNTAIVNSYIILTATVTSGATGTVTFKDGPTTIPGSVTQLSGGTASFSWHVTTNGQHLITAEYEGDGNFLGPTSSSPVSLNVFNYSSTTSLTSNSSNPSLYHDTVSFTATVTSGATGTVQFKDGMTVLGSVALSGSPNTAVFSTSALAGGQRSITATYIGDSNFEPSTSSTYVQTVEADGNFSGSGKPLVTDALKALRFAAGLDIPTATDILHGDVAPLVNGKPQPDGKIDMGDVVVILRNAVGLVSW